MKNYTDLLIKNIKVYNSYFKKFNVKDIYIKDGKFLYIGKGYDDELKPKKKLMVREDM